MRGLRWIIPLITTVILLSSVGLVSAQIANTVIDTSTGPAIGDAKLVAQAEKKEGTRKGYVGVFTSPVTGAQVSASSTTGAEGFTASATGAQVFTLTIKKRDGLVAATTKNGDAAVADTTEQEEILIRIPVEGLEAITRRPGRVGAAVVSASSTDLDGAEVAVLVQFVIDESTGELVPEALKIVVKPDPQLHIVGVVTEVETNEEGDRILTILRRNGKTKVVRLGPEFDSPEIGEVLTALPGRSDRARGPSEGDESSPPTVRGLVRAETVHQRLEGILRSLTAGNGVLSDKAAERLAKRVDRVATALESHAELKVAIIEKLTQKQDLSPRAVKGLAKALGKAKDARAQAKADAKAARDNAPHPASPGRTVTTGRPAGATAGDEDGQPRPDRQDEGRGRRSD